MELADLLGLLRRWWLTLLVALTIGGVAGYLVGSGVEPTYEVETRLLVGPLNTDHDTQRAAGGLVQTYADIAGSQEVYDPAARTLGPEADQAGLVEASGNETTRVLTIRVRDTDPVRASDFANAVAAELRTLTEAADRSEGLLRPIDVAELPETPVAPNVSLIAIMGGLAGLISAVALVSLIEYLSGSASLTLTDYLRGQVRDANELRELTGVRPLGVVDAGGFAPADDFLEAVKRLQPRLGSVRRLLVAGVAEGDSSQGVAISVLEELRDTGLCVDYMAMPDAYVSPGHRTNGRQGAGVVAEGGIAGVDVSGPLDGVVVHAPALGATADPAVSAAACDAAILVASARSAQRIDVASAVEKLHRAGVPLLGTVWGKDRWRPHPNRTGPQVEATYPNTSPKESAPAPHGRREVI